MNRLVGYMTNWVFSVRVGHRVRGVTSFPTGCKIAVQILQLFVHGIKWIKELRFTHTYTCWEWVRVIS